MKRILMRQQMPYDEPKNPSEILLENLIGNNTGNLLFQTSIARTVMTGEDDVIRPIKTSRKFSEAEIADFNENYDMFVIPLANAFRKSFKEELTQISDLIERLTIPCVVIGVGMQRRLDATRWEFSYDEHVRRFMKLVLERSSMVGIRGEITAKYLRTLGYREEKDFTVIGCPSLYRFGNALPAPKPTDLSPRSKVCTNFKTVMNRPLYEFLRRQMTRFDDCVFLSQVRNEIWTMYVGYPFPEEGIGRDVPGDYPIPWENEMIRRGKMLGVLDEVSWIDYLKGRDFAFGSRIHGNIAAILAGIPCFIFAADGRVKELAEYHHIPHVGWDEITPDMDVIDLYQKTDYSELLRSHKQRTAHYMDFLEENKVPHLSADALGRTDTPYDKMRAKIPGVGVIRPLPNLSPAEQQARLREYHTAVEKRETEAAEHFQVYKEKSREKLSAKNARIKALEQELREIKSSKFYKAKVKYDQIKHKGK